MQLATPEAFEADPALVWRWYQWRRGIVADAQPNAGHLAIAALEQALSRPGGRSHEGIAPGGAPTGTFTLVTQNVDGLHRKAGNTDPIEFHGNLWANHCSVCGAPGGIAGEDIPLDVDEPPNCAACHSLLRPSVVWFGEGIPEAAITRSFEAVQRCEVCIVVGTSSLVYPAAALPQVALEAGAEVIEVNPEETPLTPHVSRSLRGSAGDVLPGLVEELVAALD
jgi:NAD-dependent deacetylase